MKVVSQVFWKEVQGIHRIRLGFVARGLVPLAMLVAIHLAVKPKRPPRVITGFGGVQLSSSDLARIGGDLFALIMVVQAVLVALLVPLLTAAVVAGEKERRTLGLLMLSNLKPRQVLLDKLLVRLLWLGLLCFTIAPVLLMFLGLGGVTVEQILQAYLSLLAIVLLATALGCLCTVWSQTVVGAALATYLLLIPICLGIAWGWERFVELAALLGLLDVLETWRYDVALESLYGESSLGAVCLLVLVCGGLLALSVMMSGWLLPRMAYHESLGIAWRAYGWLHDLFAGQGRLSKVLVRNRPLKRNSLYWRECHRRFTTTNQFCVRASYLTLLFCMLWYGIGVPVSYLLEQWDFEAIALAFYLVPPAVVPLVAALAGTNGYAREMQRGSWELLLTTPVVPQQVVLGKWLGMLKSLTPAWLLLVLVVATLAYMSNEDFMETGMVLAHCMSSVLMIATLGLTLGLFLKRTTRAFLATLLLTPVFFGLAGGWPLWIHRYRYRNGWWAIEEILETPILSVGLLVVTVVLLLLQVWYLRRQWRGAI